jgi:cbb3-type cytochrome oxidase maturation protein
MSVLIILIIIALLLLILFFLAFLWALKDGQFDDMETPAMRSLFDD